MQASYSPRSMARVFIILFCSFCFAFNNGGVEGRGPAIGKAQVPTKRPMARGTGRPYFYDAAGCLQQGGEYYGARATLSVFALPDTESGQTSDSSIMLSKGFPDYWGQQEAVNTIRAGWHVNPALYGDTRTRLYTYWTTTAEGSTGCYNLQCPGFVPRNTSPIRPGDILAVSSDRGQKYITLTINQNRETGDWWLYYHDDVHGDVVIGHWPKSLFTSLAKKANIIQFGGEVSYTASTKGPAMGSGHFASEAGKAASFKGMQHADRSGNFLDYNFRDLKIFADNESCYDTNLALGSDGKVQLYYGGPSGCQE